MSRLRLFDRPLCLIQVSPPNQSTYSTWYSWRKLLILCEMVKSNESTPRDFNGNLGINARILSCVICEHGDADVNDNGKLLL